ncbi:MAG: SPOR domain-containing protein [Candidatus Cloacimonetes bacterium]|nr:SPOR domain-containing protein [Candidatus Cloacimonadota bacterium]
MTRTSPQATRNLVLLILLLFIALSASAAIRKEFTDLEDQFHKGKIDEVQDALVTLKPNSSDERACISFYTAMLKIKKTDAVTAHEQLIAKYPKSSYAQMSLLELGKLQILERNIEEAKASLKKISSTGLMERFYWLGLCAWWQDDYTSAINHAENYLRMDAKGEYCEAAHYLIAECYLSQKKAYSAITTLGKLQKLNLQDVDEQYLLYRLGFAYEQSDKLKDALGYYQQGYELDNYSQIAYLIEDRLFEIRSRNKSVDISFLYPYSLLQIPIITEEPNTPIVTITPAPQTPKPTEMQTPNAPVKLKAKPTAGYWLQAGRFSLEANANKLVINIRLLSLPAVYYEDVSRGKISWVVLCGAFEEKAKAEAAKSQLVSSDINCFVTQY